MLSFAYDLIQIDFCLWVVKKFLPPARRCGPHAQVKIHETDISLWASLKTPEFTSALDFMVVAPPPFLPCILCLAYSRLPWSVLGHPHPFPALERTIVLCEATE